jgi:hypothetical protein
MIRCCALVAQKTRVVVTLVAHSLFEASTHKVTYRWE